MIGPHQRAVMLAALRWQHLVDQLGGAGAVFASFRPHLRERDRRLWAAWSAWCIGRGGISTMAAATGLARSTIRRGMQDLGRAALPPGRQRRPRARRWNGAVIRP